MKTPDWSKDDDNIDDEFASIVDMANASKGSEPVPQHLDRQIKHLARINAEDDLQQNWIFSNGARLTLGILVFFAIAMIWVSL